MDMTLPPEVRAVALAAMYSMLAFEGKHVDADRLLNSSQGARAIIRAVSSPADSTTPGWAAELVRTILLGYVRGLPGSVAAAIQITDGGLVKVPSKTAGAVFGWVSENGYIPVGNPTLGLSEIGRYKAGLISVFTWELLRSSDAEAIIQQILVEDSRDALDKAMADTAAAKWGPGRFAP